MTSLPRRRLLDLWSVLAVRIAARFDPVTDRGTGPGGGPVTGPGTGPDVDSDVDPDIDPGVGAWPSRDSLRDAEQLVCLLYPAMRVPALGFADPDGTSDDVLSTLAPLGDHKGLARTVAEVCGEYFEAYTDADGRPVFSGGPVRVLDDGAPSARAAAPVASDLETVESFSIAVTLSLSVLAFVRESERHARAAATRERLAALRNAASARLTHAMSALCESFVADVFARDSAKGRSLLASVFRDGIATEREVRELQGLLRPIRVGLGGLAGLAGPGGRGADLDDDTMLFSCGWSWGRAKAPGRDRAGHDAAAEPSLYFTVAAMDGIVDLFSSRHTLLPGLLDSDQLALVQQLLVRWELTQRYWSSLARFGGPRWALEDIPWRGDGDSDYRTLHVASILVHDLMRQGAPDEPPPHHDLGRLVGILCELAGRARITRQALPGDPAVALHSPGMIAPLAGSERLGRRLGWAVTDFAPTLLKRTLQVAALARNMEHRDTLLALADIVTDHVWGRRLDSGPAAGLWDAPDRVYPHGAAYPAELCWHMTERVAEVLVVAAAGIAADLAPSPLLSPLAADMLREADHLYAREMLERATPTRATDAELHLVGAVLERARDRFRRSPGTTVALVSEALRRLDELAAAREQASRGMI